MTAITSPNGIAYVRLASLKGRLSLEKAGMKSRGPAMRTVLAEELGLKPRDSFDKFIAEIQKRMAELLATEQANYIKEVNDAYNR